MTQSALSDFKLYFEHLPDCPMIEAEKRCKQERKDVIEWAKRELAFAIMTYNTPKRRPHATSHKR